MIPACFSMESNLGVSMLLFGDMPKYKDYPVKLVAATTKPTHTQI